MRFIRLLISKERTRRTNRQLGGLLAFIAGAVNAGGFLAVHRYTSHMTGIVSAIADDIVLGNLVLAFGGVAFLIAFASGAATTAVMVNWARHHKLQSEFALPIMLEAILLLIFGVLGSNLNALIEVFVPTTVLLLCFIMGLQNAIVTKASKAEIRTTHMTGVVTDLGIELGRLMFWNRTHDPLLDYQVVADKDRLRIHSAVLGLFFGGALAGAIAYKAFGFFATVPIAAVLMAISAPTLLQEFAAWTGLRRRGIP